jgi:hypothetical protein
MHKNIRVCPFCGYDEGWIQFDKNDYYVECKVCKSRGPISENHEEAIYNWNADDIEINEEAMGGVSAPIATLNNTPGIGNAVPATQAATTGAQFTSDSVKGSGDNWNNETKKKSKKKKFTISTFEDFVKENNL